MVVAIPLPGSNKFASWVCQCSDEQNDVIVAFHFDYHFRSINEFVSGKIPSLSFIVRPECARLGTIVLRQHAPYHVFIDLEAEHKTKLLGDPAAAPTRVESLGFDDGRDPSVEVWVRVRGPDSGLLIDVSPAMILRLQHVHRPGASISRL